MWIDKLAFSQWLKLRDKFRVKILVETGCAWGIGTLFYSQHFQEVHACDVNWGMIRAAESRTRKHMNVFLYHQRSPEFLRDFRRKCEEQNVLFFLDAHWYNDWPIKEELKALEGFGPCIVVIHDFKAHGLGYVSYLGQDLDWEYVGAEIKRVHPGSHLYTNFPGACDIVTLEEVAQRKIPGLRDDPETRATLERAWSDPSKTYRGMLYMVPEVLDNTYQLKEWHGTES